MGMNPCLNDVHQRVLTALILGTIWVWIKIKELGLRRFSSLVPFTKVPFGYIEPQPFPFAGFVGSV